MLDDVELDEITIPLVVEAARRRHTPKREIHVRRAEKILDDRGGEARKPGFLEDTLDGNSVYEELDA